MSSLKKKTTSGLLWSSADKFSTMLIQFVFGIILARLLLPKDYGLIGMLAIFMAISQTIVESGFGRALIQKKEADQKDYSTIFFFNFLVSLIVYLILYVSSGYIADFYGEPMLVILTKIVGLNIIISSASIIQRTILIKQIDFRTQAIVNISAGFLGAFAGISCAIAGLGVWSLVIQYLTRNAMTTILFWVLSSWRPSMIFSVSSLKNLFDFGSKILMSSLLYTAFQNIYLVVIGKLYKIEELGYFTRATLFKQIPATFVTTVIQSVTYSVLVNVIEDDQKARAVMVRSIRLIGFLLFPMVVTLIFFAEPLILVLLTEKWMPTVILLQILALGVIFFPINAINVNYINAKGRSDLFLRLEIINITLTIIAIAVTYSFGITIMATGYVCASCIGFFAYAYYSHKFIQYSAIQQLKDLIPYIVTSVLVVGFSYYIVSFLENSLWKLILGIPLDVLLYLGVSYMLKFKELLEIKEIILSKIKKKN